MSIVIKYKNCGSNIKSLYNFVSKKCAKWLNISNLHGLTGVDTGFLKGGGGGLGNWAHTRCRETQNHAPGHFSLCTDL